MKCAWFVAALALGACGKVLEAQPDGGGDDGGGDGPPDVPVRGRLKVTVLDRANTGAPAVGVDVVFVEADGTIAARETTDSNGKAEADVFPGASVTSVTTLTGGKFMVTVGGLSPGDDAVIGRFNPDQTAVSTFVVNWTQAPGAFSYFVYTPCGFETVTGQVSTKTITMREHCNPATMELLVQARNSDGDVVGTSKKTVTVATGNTTMPAFTTGGNISFNANITNISNTSQLTFRRGSPEGLGHGDPITATNVATTGAFNVLDPSTEKARIDHRFQGPTGNSVEIRQRLAGNASTYGLDFSSVALPWVNQPALDFATRTLSVTTLATGTSGDAPDLVEWDLSWRRGGKSFTWTLFLPTLDSVVLPALPDNIADGVPTTGDDITVNVVKTFEADTIDDYAAIRTNIAAALHDTLVDAPLGNGELGTASLVRVSTSISGGN